MNWKLTLDYKNSFERLDIRKHQVILSYKWNKLQQICCNTFYDESKKNKNEVSYNIEVIYILQSKNFSVFVVYKHLNIEYQNLLN